MITNEERDAQEYAIFYALKITFDQSNSLRK
jgi:hypothetical protein